MLSLMVARACVSVECVCVCDGQRFLSFPCLPSAAGLPVKPTRLGTATVASFSITGPRHTSRPSYRLVVSAEFQRVAPGATRNNFPRNNKTLASPSIQEHAAAPRPQLACEARLSL